MNTYQVLFLLLCTTVTLQGQIDIQGHRGCRGLMPENSLEGMLHAVRLGVRTLEMDLVISADSQVVVSHEPWMSARIALSPQGAELPAAEERSYNLFRMPYEDIRSFDCGTRFHPDFPDQQKIPVVKPLLTDVIRAVEDYVRQRRGMPVYYNLEIKSAPQGDDIYHPAPAPFCELVLRAALALLPPERITVQSFDMRILRYIHETYPHIRLALLTRDLAGSSAAARIDELGFAPDIFSPHFSLVTETLLDECALMDMQVIPWTVNDAPTMQRLIGMGVHGLITDYPDTAISLYGPYNTW